MRKKVRTLRHWKQRFNRDADFVFRRRLTYGTKAYKPGDPVPEELTGNPTKLRRFWESSVIELAEFEAPNVATGQREPKGDTEQSQIVELDDPIDGVSIVKGKGSWFLVTTPNDDEAVKVNGKRALREVLDQLRVEKGTDDEPEAGDVDNSEPEATEDVDDSDAASEATGNDAPSTTDDAWLDGGEKP